jgi:8-oxo-dGTP pyrophosphatase MutT (NUDIX family)
MPLAQPLTDRLVRLRQSLAESSPRAEEDSAVLWASVAVVLTPEPDAILLIRRAERKGDPWSGHMALPGGRKSLSDEDLLATVIRETREEVGVTLRGDQLIGCLDDVAPRTPVLPPIAIRPFSTSCSIPRPTIRCDWTFAAKAGSSPPTTSKML